MSFNTKLCVTTLSVAAQLVTTTAIMNYKSEQDQTRRRVENVIGSVLSTSLENMHAKSNKERMDPSEDCFEKMENFMGMSALSDPDFLGETDFGEHCRMKDWLEFRCDLTDVFEENMSTCEEMKGVAHLLKMKVDCGDFIGIGELNLNIKGLLMCLPACFDVETLIELMTPPETDLPEDICKIKIINPPVPPTISPAPTVSAAPVSASDRCLEKTNEFKDINRIFGEDLDSGCNEVASDHSCNEKEDCVYYDEVSCDFSSLTQVTRDNCVNDGGVLHRVQGINNCTEKEEWEGGSYLSQSVTNWEGIYVCIADSCDLDRDLEMIVRKSTDMPSSCTFTFDASAPTVSPAPSTAFEGQCLAGHNKFQEINVALSRNYNYELMTCEYSPDYSEQRCDLSEATEVTKDNCTKEGGVLYRLKYTNKCDYNVEIHENMYMCIDTDCDIDEYIKNVIRPYYSSDNDVSYGCEARIENDPLSPTVSPAPSPYIDQCITETKDIPVQNILDEGYSSNCNYEWKDGQPDNVHHYDCTDASSDAKERCNDEGGVIYRFKASDKCKDGEYPYNMEYADLYVCLASSCDADAYAKHFNSEDDYCKKTVKVDSMCPDGEKEMSVELFTDYNADTDNTIHILTKDRNGDWKSVHVQKQFKNNHLNINQVCLMDGGCHKVVLKDKSKNGISAGGHEHYTISYGRHENFIAEDLNSNWDTVRKRFGCSA